MTDLGNNVAFYVFLSTHVRNPFVLLLAFPTSEGVADVEGVIAYGGFPRLEL
jgi:hypothetical protein